MDYGHEQTDLALKRLEKKLSSEYSKAAKTVEGKLTAHLNEFKKLDAQYSQQVADGKMDQSKYLKWRKTAMMTGKKWQDTREVLVSDMNNANKIAIGLINNSTIDAYALNMNYGTYEVESGTNLDTSFTLYDHATVENLMRDDPQMIPKARLDIPKDKLWNRQKLTSAIAQGILTGDSIPEIAERLTAVAGMNANAAIRNARTYTTAAENKGRVDSYYRAQGLGIELKQEWMATLDMRTRSSHRHLDGEKVEVGKKFSNGCRYPGDPDGPPWEIYNCRCTLVAAIDGFDDSAEKRFSRLPEEGMTYEEWKNWRDKPEQKDGQKVVDGKDISGTWTRRPDKFDFEIEDVINAQGFDGLPRILKGKAFDDAVKAANGGNGFIAQRAYSAPDMDTLNAYRDQLYRGKWYVDCSTGGAQYGQGMYCAADYTGTMTPGIQSEMEHYRKVGEGRHGANLSAERYKAIQNAGNNITEALRISNMSDEEFAREFGFADKAVSYTETLTLDPSAKIIDYNDLFNERFRFHDEFIAKDTDKTIAEQLSAVGLGNNKDAVTFMRFQLGYGDVDWDTASAARAKLSNDELFSIGSLQPQTKDAVTNSRITLENEYSKKYGDMDVGSFAAMRGYDAIDATGHGQSGSYTVILNRTKLIIKGD